MYQKRKTSFLDFIIGIVIPVIYISFLFIYVTVKKKIFGI